MDYIYKCKNHPDRTAKALYGKGKEVWGLCLECFDQRMADLKKLPLDEHGQRMAEADKRAKENSDDRV